jgi:hypothetical protein
MLFKSQNFHPRKRNGQILILVPRKSQAFRYLQVSTNRWSNLLRGTTSSSSVSSTARAGSKPPH